MFVARLARLAAIAITAACGSTTEPTLTGTAPTEFTVTAEQRGDQAGSILPPGANASAGPNSIIVMGHIRTATPCYDLAPKVARSGERTTVTVTARSADAQVCAQVLVVRAFTLRIPELAAGDYAVKVVYQFIDSRTTEETVFDKTVKVVDRWSLVG